jgi:hypothetical protein
MGAENDLKRVCAWCGKDMGMKPSAETGTTHGMCPSCLKKEMGEMENMKTAAEKRNEAAAEGARRYGSAKNESHMWAAIFTTADKRRLRLSVHADTMEQADREGRAAAQREYGEVQDFRVQRII